MSFNHDIEGHTTDKSVLAAREEHKAWLMSCQLYHLAISLETTVSLDGDDAYVMFRIAIFLPFFCQRQIAIERG